MVIEIVAILSYFLFLAIRIRLNMLRELKLFSIRHPTLGTLSYILSVRYRG